MDIHSLSPNVSVSGQVGLDDIPALKAQGFKSIVANRPDREGPDQPDHAELAAAAAAEGMELAYLPVAPGHPTDAQAYEFRDLFARLPKPVLAFCRTGTRSTMLWALAARDRLSTEEVMRTAARAGVDLEPLRERLEQAD